jgi:hypothetical protein
MRRKPAITSRASREKKSMRMVRSFLLPVQVQG